MEGINVRIKAEEKFQKHLEGKPIELLSGLVVRNEGGRGIQSNSRMGSVWYHCHPV